MEQYFRSPLHAGARLCNWGLQRVRIIVHTTLSALALVTGPAVSAPVTALDSLHRTVNLAAPAQRVVTLAPHATELVVAAGGQQALVGSVAGPNLPPLAPGVTRVGDARRLHPEALIALQPDLIIAWLPSAMLPVEHIMQTLGASVFYSHPKRLADIPAQIDSIGRLLGTSAIASQAANNLRERLRNLQFTYHRSRPLRVFVQVGQDPLYTLNGEHIISDVLQRCGAANVFAGLPVPAPVVSIEAVLQAQPDAIVAAQAKNGFPDAQTYWARYAAALPAARAIVSMDEDLLYRPGPRLVSGAEQLCAALATHNTP